MKRYNQISKVQYSKILSHWDIIKNKDLLKKIKDLDHKDIRGGLKAIWNYPKENNPTDVVIAFYNKNPIGIVTLTDGYQNIFIKPEFRKQKIASKLKKIIYKI